MDSHGLGTKAAPKSTAPVDTSPIHPPPQFLDVLHNAIRAVGGMLLSVLLLASLVLITLYVSAEGWQAVSNAWRERQWKLELWHQACARGFSPDNTICTDLEADVRGSVTVLACRKFVAAVTDIYTVPVVGALKLTGIVVVLSACIILVSRSVRSMCRSFAVYRHDRREYKALTSGDGAKQL